MIGDIRLLHVDDEPEFADLAAQLLEREDRHFNVTTATSADTGLDLLAEREFDCIVSDYDMPERDGIEFLEAVREEYPDLPFILFTGKGSEEIASEAISAGVTDYLQKETGTDQYAVLANRVRNVVEKYRAERTAQRVRQLAEQTNDILWMFSADWDELLFVNSAYEDIWGRPTDTLEAEPRDFLNGVHPDDRNRVQAAMERLSDGEPVDLEYRVNENEDYARWVWVQGTPIRDATGDVVRVAGFARDVTDRRRRERILEELHAVATDLTTYDTQAAICERTVAAAEALLEFDTCAINLETDGVLEPVATSDQVPPGGVSAMTTDEGLAGKTYQTEKSFLIDDVQTHADAEPQGPYRAALSIPIGDMGVFQAVAEEPGVFDDTDRDLIELLLAHTARALERLEHTQRLERERDRFEAIFDAMPDPVAHVEYEGEEPIIRTINPAFGDTFDIEPAAAVGRSVNDVVASADRQVEARRVDAQLRSKGQIEREVTRRAGDEERTFLFRGTRLELDPDRMEVIGVYTDLTERRERERELRAMRDRMEFALDATDSVIFEIDLDTHEETYHGAFERLYGIPSDEISTSEEFYERAVHPEDRDRLRALESVEAIQDQSGTIECEYRTNPATGSVKWLRSKAQLRTDEHGQPDRLIGSATDVTTHKKREQKLQQQNERLEEFAAIVSHDLRNPLNVVDGKIELARAECDSTHLDDAKAAVGRSIALLEDLLTLAREGRQVGEREPVELRELVEGCWQTVASKRATLRIETDQTIEADRSRIQQLVENLVQNALDHGDPEVTITVGDLDDDTGFYVADDGPGIPPGERDEIFKPGYSSKDSGTGFGLNIVQEIAEAHGWTVQVTESASGGARFEVTGVEQPD